MRIAIDLDGVLAEFNQSYENLLAELAGQPAETHDPDGPDHWFWDAKRYPDPIIARAWLQIEQDRYFWMSLPALDNMVHLVNAWPRLMQEHDVYFITVRPGKTAKYQSEVWLTRYLGILSTPTVIVLPPGAGKGEIARVLKLDALIDDRPECVDEAYRAGVPHVYLQDRNYNKHCNIGQRVQSLAQMFRDLRV